jgi:hypothetical protein
MSRNNLPNFIIVGFPKCGSTALHYYLESHPEIYMPLQKELHYFTSDKLLKLNKGPGDKEVKKFMLTSLIEYQKAYKNVRDEKAIGDASPSYINHPDKIPFIKETLKRSKIIILLRDPIKRAYSNYLHLLREKREHLPFLEALEEEDNRAKKKYSDFWYYKYNSTYFEKVDKFKKSFDEVLIITQEELNNNTIKTVKKVYSFLGVSEITPENADQRYNAGGIYKDNFMTNLLLKQSVFRSTLKKLIPITPKMKKYKEKIIAKYKTKAPAISDEAENYLVERLKEDVLKLNQVYNVDISNWNKKFKKQSIKIYN